MFLEESPEQQRLRAELRRYYAELLTDEVRAGLAEGGEGGDAWREVVSQVGKDGWLGIGWPVEFGDRAVRRRTSSSSSTRPSGRGAVPLRHHQHRGADHHALRHRGAEVFLPAQDPRRRAQFRHRLHRARGGHRPRLAAHRAVRDGEEYVINGAKIFTWGADQADYIWLAVRTDPDVPKHKGISILCVPTTSPGFEWSIIHTVGGLPRRRPSTTTCACRWPTGWGDENEGWRMITTQLNHERVGLAAWSGLAISLYEDVVGGRRNATDDGATLIDQGWVQMDLAKCHAELRGHVAAELAHGRARGRRRADRGRVVLDQGLRDRAHHRGAAPAVGDRGRGGLPHTGLARRGAAGRLEATGRQAQINTFGGGVNEVQREIVATAGLGMTRGSR